MKQIKYTHRYLARIIIEAVTPLAVGSGEKDFLTDARVALDSNGLPYIPGTSLAGVVRGMLEQEEADVLFGCQGLDPKDGHGSEIIFSDARMIGKNGEVLDGLKIIDFKDPSFYRYFAELPVRQHVRIDHRGTADKGGKFDEQVVFKGTRFCFEVEILYGGDEEQRMYFEKVLKTLEKNSFRIGGGCRNGFGEVDVILRQTVDLNLNIPEQLTDYLNKSASLEDATNWWRQRPFVKRPAKTNEGDEYDTYKLSLHPKDFFLFGAGFGDSQADMVPVGSTVIKWDETTYKLLSINETNILIPASSVKGALAHRVAYFYNMSRNRFADLMTEEEIVKIGGGKNEAVRALFGYEEKDDKGNHTQVPGNILFSDLIKDETISEKLFNHVSIDRFTGGAIDGALYTEKAAYTDSVFEITFLVKKGIKTEYMDAFINALKDVCHERLPLGSGANRGHGFFSGKLYVNGKEYLWKN